ncbi:MAG: polyphenol oxidase family protein [Gemmatimonadota bacterium]
MIRPTRSRVHVRRIEEVFRPGNPGCWVHPEWGTRFPWLVQGTTGRVPGEGEAVWDFALFADPPVPGARDSWEGLGRRLGFPQVAHSHQVHGRDVLVRGREGLADVGLDLGPDADGHVTDSRGLLLGVTVADCVPVSVVDPRGRAVGLLHAGWRGAVAGILERGFDLLGHEFGSSPQDLHLHLGPAICGDCYEVGGEVHVAMGLPEPEGPSPVDIRNHLVSRALTAGVGEARITESAWCTLCGESPFFSHRRGELGRQVGFLGIIP